MRTFAVLVCSNLCKLCSKDLEVFAPAIWHSILGSPQTLPSVLTETAELIQAFCSMHAANMHGLVPGTRQHRNPLAAFVVEQLLLLVKVYVVCNSSDAVNCILRPHDNLTLYINMQAMHLKCPLQPRLALPGPQLSLQAISQSG